MVSGETLALTPGVIRDALRTRLLGQYGPGSGAVMVGELGLCQGRARIDLAVVGAELDGYEIKSPADSLRRLGDQAALYGRVFDRLTLVCGRRHVVPALEMLPSWWGVLRVRLSGGRVVFGPVRRGGKNAGRDARALAEFIWRDEAVALLDGMGAVRGLRKSARAYLWDRLSEVLTLDEIAGVVRSHIRETVLGGERGVLL